MRWQHTRTHPAPPATDRPAAHPGRSIAAGWGAALIGLCLGLVAAARWTLFIGFPNTDQHTGLIRLGVALGLAFAPVASRETRGAMLASAVLVVILPLWGAAAAALLGPVASTPFGRRRLATLATCASLVATASIAGWAVEGANLRRHLAEFEAAVPADLPLAAPANAAILWPETFTDGTHTWVTYLVDRGWGRNPVRVTANDHDVCAEVNDFREVTATPHGTVARSSGRIDFVCTTIAGSNVLLRDGIAFDGGLRHPRAWGIGEVSDAELLAMTETLQRVDAHWLAVRTIG